VSELGDKQKLFTWLLPLLFDEIHRKGYEFTLGDAYRDPRSHGEYGVKKDGVYGSAFSNHKCRLAIDLNLFKQGEYLRDTYHHEPFGLFWESLDKDCRWGGRGHGSDGNHYSMLFKGRW